MAKVTTTEVYCDRCGDEIIYSGVIIENMSFTCSGYDPRGDGGATYKNLEFCNKCSLKFEEWRTNKLV